MDELIMVSYPSESSSKLKGSPLELIGSHKELCAIIDIELVDDGATRQVVEDNDPATLFVQTMGVQTIPTYTNNSIEVLKLLEEVSKWQFIAKAYER